MSRVFLNILIALLLMAVNVSAFGPIDVPCGTWLELRALPHEDCRFVQWSDGNTSAVRQVEVTDDATYIAISDSVRLV